VSDLSDKEEIPYPSTFGSSDTESQSDMSDKEEIPYPSTKKQSSDTESQSDEEKIPYSAVFETSEERGTFIKTLTEYKLFKRNCTALLHQLFPGEFDCQSFLRVNFPGSCRWLKGKNTKNQLSDAKRVVSSAWNGGLKKSDKLQSLACDVKKWALRSAKAEDVSLGRLHVVVAVVKQFSRFLRGLSIQHLTVFFYNERHPEKVCSIGINLRSTFDMIKSIVSSKNVGIRISSPDRLLIQMYNPNELDIVATFPLSQLQALIVAHAIDHLQTHHEFYGKLDIQRPLI
jgi:hypothetical protein